MISAPGFRIQYREDEVTRQQVRPGTVRRVWPYLRPHRGLMVLLLGITAVGSAVGVVSTLILRLIIDDGILPHRESVVVALALAVAGLGLLDAGAEYVKSRYSAWMAESLVLELRASVSGMSCGSRWRSSAGPRPGRWSPAWTVTSARRNRRSGC